MTRVGTYPETVTGENSPRTALRKAAAKGRVRQFADRAVGRALRIGPPTDSYLVRHRVLIPMRDGVELHATHFEPRTDKPLGTVLVRCPYGRSFPLSLLYARLYAARGYHVLFQSVRGTFGSGGEFVPMVNEAADAADTVAWLREQPWFTGTFATIGLSYLGYTQWALLQDPPPELVAAVVTVAPHDMHASAWGTGSFTLNDFLGWSDLVANQEQSTLQRLLFQMRAHKRLDRGVHGLPLGAAGREFLGTTAPWYESWIEHPDSADPFWTDLRALDALDRVEIPVLLIGGWQDLFLNQTITQYHHLRRRGVDVALTVGPWTHFDMTSRAAGIAARETLDWLTTHLAKSSVPQRSSVRVLVNGHGWVDLPDWPPKTSERVLYLQQGGKLGDTPPQDTASSSTFRYDPADPTPTVGGRLLAVAAGYRIDTTLAERNDVVSFTTDPLDADLYVTGNPVVELAHHSDNPHFDLFVRISEVDETGRSRNISDGFRRFHTNPAQPVRVELDPVAQRFPSGSRIRVLVAGGSYPRFARNLGTAEPLLTGHRMVPANHTVHHGAARVSRVFLPSSSTPPSTDSALDYVRDLS